MSKTVFFFRGLPGTGKTTLCTRIREYGKHLSIATVSRDIIREKIRTMRDMEVWDYSDENEAFVSDLFNEELMDALSNPKYDWILIDNTNLSIHRAGDLARCIQAVEEKVEPPIEFKVVILQLGFWTSKMRQHPQISDESEYKMRKTMRDDGHAYLSIVDQLPNWWYFMSKCYSDVSLCSGFVPFNWKWRTPVPIGGCTRATTDILCNYFDPSLDHRHPDFSGLFFKPFETVFSQYFCEQ